MTGLQGAVNRAIKQIMVLILCVVLTCTLDKAICMRDMIQIGMV